MSSDKFNFRWLKSGFLVQKIEKHEHFLKMNILKAREEELEILATQQLSCRLNYKDYRTRMYKKEVPRDFTHVKSLN